MSKKIRVLVFPCGSEIGLEIYRSLKYSNHIELFGASSVNDHGKFVYEKYIGNVPFIDSENFIETLKTIVNRLQIDAIYPAMDSVIFKLKKFENELGCKVIASSVKTSEICLSKRKTYTTLSNYVDIPLIYSDFDTIDSYPVFIKPDVGYGSRGTYKAIDTKALNLFFNDKKIDEYIIAEYLTGDEYTIDCFTDRKGKLRYTGPRQRNRVNNGISVNTSPVDKDVEDFFEIARIINQNIEFRGAWFFQLKRNRSGKLTLLEIASRLGGSSALFRGKGVNFALMSVFDAFDYDLEIIENNYAIEMDRALDNKFKIDVNFDSIYVDFDDCLVIDNQVNTQLISFLYQSLNQKKKIILITKHEGDLYERLDEFRLKSIFDEIIHLKKDDEKFKYIKSISAIFIDDSFVERKKIKEKLNLSVFSPDMIQVL